MTHLSHAQQSSESRGCKGYTFRERLVRTLRGEEVDRPPFGVGVGFFPWDLTLERWKDESGIPDLDVVSYFGYEPDFMLVPLNLGVWPPFQGKVLAEDDRTITMRNANGLVYRTMRDGSSMHEFLDNPVHNRDEWQRFKAERLDPEAPGRFVKPGYNYSPGNNVEWETTTVEETAAEVARRADQLQVGVQVGTFPWGLFGTARDILGVEELLVSFHTDPDLVHDIMDTLTDLWIGLYEKVIPLLRIDCIFLWEDMCCQRGPLISPAMVDEFMMPNYKKIHDFALSHDIPLMCVDTDGDVDEIVPTMTEHGVNVMLPFEVQSGCDIEEYRRKYPEMGIIGGLNKHALTEGRKAIDAELEKAERMLESGRYIPGLDHLVPPDVPWHAFVYYAERLKAIMGVRTVKEHWKGLENEFKN